jgi:hypothetical protein
VKKPKPVHYVLTVTNSDGVMLYWSNIKEGGLTEDVTRARKYNIAQNIRIAWRKLKDRPSIGFIKHDYVPGIKEVEG